jgi:phospholipid-binding lipoprotein MlaA
MLLLLAVADPVFALSPSGPDRLSGPLLASTDFDGDGTGENGDNPWDEEPEETPLVVRDPLSGFNRAMFTFNDRLYFWVLKPVSEGYRAVVPRPARQGIKNFFNNLRAPIRFVSCVLQGKGHAAMAEYSKFVINSTAGILGFGNPTAKYPQLNPSEEDMGQTLGVYGVGNGIYLVLPIFGPSTLRDAVGMIADRFFLDPAGYIEPPEAQIGVNVWETVNSTSFRIGDYESLKDASIKPYEAFRNAYIQYRSKRISE